MTLIVKNTTETIRCWTVVKAKKNFWFQSDFSREFSTDLQKPTLKLSIKTI